MSKFQNHLGGTTACTKRLAIATKGYGQLTSIDTYFEGICSNGVETDEQVMAEGVDYCCLLKTIHKGFFLATLEKLMKDWPGLSYLVIKNTPRVTGGRPLMNIGYKYNYRKVLGFIYTEGAGSI